MTHLTSLPCFSARCFYFTANIRKFIHQHFLLNFAQSILENKVSINKNSFLGYYGMPSYTASRTNANNLLKYLVNSITYTNTFQAATYYVISKDSKQIFTETL